jgi:hypothetical protein
MTPTNTPGNIAGEPSDDTHSSEVSPRLRLIPSRATANVSPRHPKGQLPRRAPDDTVVHRADRPSFCPSCGSAYADTKTGIVVEYWSSYSRVFHCWCASCDQAFDIADANQVITEEIEH